MGEIEDYRKKFKKLHVDHNRNRYTAGKAPHKPVLLLTVMILHQNGKADLHDIKPDLYLRETWSELWDSLEYQKPGPIHLPMYHMISEGFWDLDLKSGVSPHQPKSLGELRNMTDRIAVRDDLADLIRDEGSRNDLINSLLHGGYFSDEEIEKLKVKIADLSDSFVYENEINQMVREEFINNHREDHYLSESQRDPAFRRSILEVYDETCSVCGMKLITPSGISVNDAAHILPFSKFHNDDIRNGLCLCKNHHWLFDRFLISVDPHYRIIVSKNIEREFPEDVISRYHREDLILPGESEKYPHPKALEWHRDLLV